MILIPIYGEYSFCGYIDITHPITLCPKYEETKECGLSGAPEAILYAKVKDNHEDRQKLTGEKLCGL